MRIPFLQLAAHRMPERKDFLPLCASLLALFAATAWCIWTLVQCGWQLVGPQSLIAPFAQDVLLKKRIVAIRAQHPFGMPVADGNPVSGEQSTSSAENSPWRLLATLASASGQGMALLDRDGGETKVVEVGDALAPGQRVSTIGTDGITLATPNGKQHMELAPVLAADTSPTPPPAQRNAKTAPIKDGAPPPAADIVNVHAVVPN